MLLQPRIVVFLFICACVAIEIIAKDKALLANEAWQGLGHFFKEVNRRGFEGTVRWKETPGRDVFMVPTSRRDSSCRASVQIRGQKPTIITLVRKCVPCAEPIHSGIWNSLTLFRAPKPRKPLLRSLKRTFLGCSRLH